MGNRLFVLVLIVASVFSLSVNSSKVSQPLDLEKTALLDTVYDSYHFNPFVRADETSYIRIQQDSDSTLFIQHDSEQQETDSLFAMHERMDSLGFKNFGAIYFDVINQNNACVDLRYASRNADYEAFAIKSKIFSVGFFIMYQSGFFRLTYGATKISISWISTEFDHIINICDYAIIF